MHIYISICTYAYTYICVHTLLISAAHTCSTQLPTPRYVLHVFLSLFIKCALTLIILLCSYSILCTLLIAVGHSLHTQTPCHTQHPSLRALMINNPLSPCCSRRLFTPPVASKPCCAHAHQSAACYLHACILVWCIAHVSTSCYS